MGFDAYMKVAGVEGESVSKGFEKWIDILSFSWGVSQTSTYHGGSGGTGGKCNVSDFSIVKKIDAATAPIFMHCCTGEHFDTVEIVLRKAGGKGGQVDFLKYKFTQAIISGVRPGGSSQGADDIPLEEVSMTFAKAEFDYTLQTEKGGKGGASHGGWDIAKNEPA
jgi:type VI secretion system secreted protein Hcp